MFSFKKTSEDVIVVKGKKEVDLDALNLLAFGQIPGLCKCSYKSEKDNHCFKYEIKEYIPISCLPEKLTFENIVDVLSAVTKLIRKFYVNNLNINNLIISKEYIFKNNDEYKFVYLPINDKHKLKIKNFILKFLRVIYNSDIRIIELIKEIKKEKTDEDIILHIEGLISSYEQFNKYSENSTSNLMDKIETSILCEEETTLLESKHIDNVHGFISDEETTLLSNDDKETTVLRRSVYDLDNDSINFSETFGQFNCIMSETETTVFSIESQSKSRIIISEENSNNNAYLIKNLNREKILINVTPFNVGKDSDNMDCILKNANVSRHHATILYEKDKYYIIDNNSTNGTVIEGVKIPVNEKVEIESGDIISFGDVTFQFYTERR